MEYGEFLRQKRNRAIYNGYNAASQKGQKVQYLNSQLLLNLKIGPQVIQTAKQVVVPACPCTPASPPNYNVTVTGFLPPYDGGSFNPNNPSTYPQSRLITVPIDPNNPKVRIGLRSSFSSPTAYYAYVYDHVPTQPEKVNSYENAYEGKQFVNPPYIASLKLPQGAVTKRTSKSSVYVDIVPSGEFIKDPGTFTVTAEPSEEPPYFTQETDSLPAYSSTTYSQGSPNTYPTTKTFDIPVDPTNKSTTVNFNASADTYFGYLFVDNPTDQEKVAVYDNAYEQLDPFNPPWIGKFDGTGVPLTVQSSDIPQQVGRLKLVAVPVDNTSSDTFTISSLPSTPFSEFISWINILADTIGVEFYSITIEQKGAGTITIAGSTNIGDLPSQDIPLVNMSTLVEPIFIVPSINGSSTAYYNDTDEPLFVQWSNESSILLSKGSYILASGIDSGPF